MFRETEIQVEDKTIVLKQEPIDSIFKFGSQPYIILGTSGSGKTKLSMHLIYRYAEECTKIFYVSSTKASSFDMANDDINCIPRVFRRTPSYKDIYGIWKDIIEEDKALKASIEEQEAILSKLMGNSGKASAKLLKEKCVEVYNEQKQKYIARGDSKEDAEKSAKRDEYAMLCSALSILIVDAVNQKGNKTLSEKELLIVDSLVSAKPQTLLILDDVTAEMEALKSNRTKQVMWDGKQFPISTAYDLMLTDILTRGRHYNCLIAIFVHDINVIKTGQINNLVVFDQASAQSLRLYRKIPKTFLNTLSVASNTVFNGEYKYYFIYGRPNDNYICVGKADLQSGEIDLSPANKALVKAYDEILRLNDEDDVEEISGESDEEDVDEEEDEETNQTS